MSSATRRMAGGQALAEMAGPPDADALELALYDRQRWLLGARRSLEEMEHDRDEAVRTAARGGVPRKRICELTGLSVSRISQIVNYRR
jgi:hypothetical protein